VPKKRRLKDGLKVPSFLLAEALLSGRKGGREEDQPPAGTPSSFFFSLPRHLYSYSGVVLERERERHPVPPLR